MTSDSTPAILLARELARIVPVNSWQASESAMFRLYLTAESPADYDAAVAQYDRLVVEETEKRHANDSETI